MDLPSLLSGTFDVFITIAELLLEYLKVLAWPVAVLVLVMMYKRPLVGVLDRLRKATGWGASVELEYEARQLADASASAIDSADGKEPPRETHDPRITAWLPRSVRDDPNVIAMTVAWDRLEETTLDIGRMLGFSDNHARNVAGVVEALSGRGAVNTEMRRVALRLHNLRSSIFFADEPTLPSRGIAENFVYAADNLFEVLNEVRQGLKAELYPDSQRSRA